MTIRVSIFAAIAAVILLTVIFELIRSRRLHERYAMLWLITGGVIFVLAVWRGALSTLSSTVGIAYPPSALFVLASLFILVVLLHYSTVISKLAVQNRILAQRLALLESGMRQRGRRRTADRPGPRHRRFRLRRSAPGRGARRRRPFRSRATSASPTTLLACRQGRRSRGGRPPRGRCPRSAAPGATRPRPGR